MAANTSPPVAASAETRTPLQAAGRAEAPETLAVPEELAPAVMPVKAAKSKSRSRNRSKSAGADSKKKKTKAKEDAPRCVGYYLDALDKKMLWAEAKIIGCDVAKQKLRVHFIGWGKAHDIWTDTVSIAAHGRYAHKTKANNEMSWDGDMRLFEEMLGPIDESTPCHDLDLSSTGSGAAVVIPTSVAPPPPPTPSQRRAAKAKSLSANGSMRASAATVAPTGQGNSEAPKKRSHKRKVPAVAPAPPARASTPRSRPAAVSTGEPSNQKRPKKSPASLTTAPKKRRALSPALPEVASVEAVSKSLPSENGGTPDPLATLDARRRQLAQELELSMRFLDKCAGIFKQQLADLMSS